MSNYLTDEHRNIIGTIRITAGKEFVYDAKHPNIELGHYDPNKNETFDSYGRETASGRQLEALPYLPHRVVFPLPPKESRQFTYHTLRNHCSVGPDFWDDGVCKGCGKHGNTCVEQGLPNRCESCYRLLQLYSRTDSYDLEGMSQRKPVNDRTLRNIIQKLTRAANEVSKFIETSAKAAVITALNDDMRAGGEEKCEEVYEGETSHSGTSVRPQNTQPASGKSQADSDSGHIIRRKKRKWYQWCILILILYFVVTFLLPLTVLMIFYLVSNLMK